MYALLLNLDPILCRFVSLYRVLYSSGNKTNEREDGEDGVVNS